MSSSEPLYQRIAPDVKLGQRVKIFAFTNLYGCEIGDDVKIGAFVEIQKGVRVGNRCKISSHSFLCEGVTIEEEVFIGHGVTFINDRYPSGRQRGWQSPDRGGLEVHCHHRQARGCHRVRRDDPVRGGHWGTGDGGGRQRGDQGRAGRGNGRRQPRAAASPSPPPDAMATMRVPFLDLRVQHEPLMTELVDAFRQVTETSAFAGGPFVARFETEFAAFCGTRHALGVGSGTDALWLTLLSLGVGPGDEVITVPNSFMATAEAISLCGARPVFVDVDARSCTMDPAQVEAAITLRTQAIVPVHLFGQMADMEAILAVARRHGTPVVEDACQAHGAEQNGRRASSLGGDSLFSLT